MPISRLGRRSIRWLLTATILALFVVYFAFNTEKFRPLLDVKWWLLVLIGLGYLINIILNGLLTKFILRPFDKHLPLAETTYIALITSVGNFFAPVGAGLAFRAMYLKKKHQVSYGDYLAILAGNYLILFMVSSIFGLAALAGLHGRDDSHYNLLLLAFGGLFILSLALAAIRFPEPPDSARGWLAKVRLIMSKLSSGWRRIIHHPGLLLQLTILTTISIWLTAGITWLIVLSLHLHAGLAALLLFAVMSGLSLFLNITPANLGVKEALYIFSGAVLTFSTSQIILIALVDRGVFFIIMFVSYLALRSRGAYELS